jgi:hypothetical protein
LSTNWPSSLTLASTGVASGFCVTCKHEDNAFLMRVRNLVLIKLDSYDDDRANFCTNLTI